MMKPLYPVLISACFFTAHLNGLPQGLRSGECRISEEMGKMVIESADGAHLKWGAFNIDKDEVVQFLLPSDKSCVVNQVVEHNPSSLTGSLLSNGRVFLLNPAGILIGKDAKIDTATFVMSTFDHIARSSKDALGWKISGKSEGKISIEGAIASQSGPIVVIGEKIDCQGMLQAINGAAYLLGSDDCFVADDDGVLWSDNLIEGSELSLNGKVVARSEAIVLSQSVELGSNTVVEAPGGSILIGGIADRVSIEKGSFLNADGQNGQSGGLVVVNSLNTTHAFGHISVKGSSSGGDGGFIEVSGGYLDFQGTVDTTAPFGKTGNLLLDPLSIRIGAANMNVSGASPYTPTASPSIISTATLDAALALANVTVQSTGAAGPDSGNVFIVDDYFTGMPAGTTLTLLAFNNIEINAAIGFLSPGSLVLSAPNGSVLIGNAPTVPAQTTAGLLFAVNGDITISALDNVIVDCNGGFAGNVSAPSGTVSITTTNGDVQVLGGPGASNVAQIGSAGTIVNSDVVIDAGGDVIVSAGTGPNSMATIGHGTFTPLAPGSLSGTISVTAQGDVNVSGSTGINSYGLIGFKNGDAVNAVNIDGTATIRAGGEVNMQTGTMQRSVAVIGLFGTDFAVETWNISIDVESDGPFHMLASTGNASSLIGVHMDLLGVSPPIAVTCPLLRVVSNSTAPCTMQSSTSLIAGRAYIGFQQTGALIASNFSNITVETGGNLEMGSGFGNIIGFASDVTANMFGNISLSVGGDLVMSGGGAKAVVAVSPGSDANIVNISAQNIVATSLSGPGMYLGSSGPLSVSVAGDIQVEQTNAAAFALFEGRNGMSVIAGNDIICTPFGLGTPGPITFGYPIGGVGPIYIEAGNDIIFNGVAGGAGFSTSVLDFSLQSTSIDIVAGRNLFLGEQTVVVSLASSSINLVCDNQFPSAPESGLGRIDMVASSLVGMQGKGEIRLFTSKQHLNTISGQFSNGGSTATGLTLGPLFGDVPPEKWGIYYFNSFYYTDSIFTIFYKLDLQEVSTVANLVVSELIYTLNDFDEYLEWPEIWVDTARFRVLYDNLAKGSKGLSLRYAPDEYYWIPRQKSRFLQYPNQRRL